MRTFRARLAMALPTLVVTGLALGVSALPSQAAGKTVATLGPPIVATGAVTHVVGSSATLKGTINPRQSTTTYFFEYGPGPTATTPQSPRTTTATLTATSTSTTSVKVAASVTNFLPGYHYRLVATNAQGQTTEGKDRTFTVKKKPDFELPKTFEPLVMGGTFQLTGTLTGAGNNGHPLVLQETPYPYRTPFVNVGAPILTGAHGRFLLPRSRPGHEHAASASRPSAVRRCSARSSPSS